jgi:uncharacterized integral membrane protein
MSANIPPTGTPQQPQGSTAKDAMAEKLANPKVVIGGLITIAALWFIIANNSRVRIHLWVTWVSARLWVVLLLTFIAGALVGFLFAKRRNRRRD